MMGTAVATMESEILDRHLYVLVFHEKLNTINWDVKSLNHKGVNFNKSQ